MKILGILGSILGIAIVTVTACSHHTEPAADVRPKLPQPTTVVNGLASMGPVNSGFVDIFAVRGGVIDASTPIGRGITDANGLFSGDLGAYTGTVMVMISQGSFTDEVSGVRVALKQPMQAMASLVSTGQNTVAVTPLTDLAVAAGRGLATPEAVDDANNKISALFQVGDIIKTVPNAGGTADQKKYADACGVISQLANDRSTQKGEPLDDALVAVMSSLESELDQSHEFSSDTLAGINAAVAEFNKNGAAAAALLPSAGTLKISTAGPTNMIGTVNMTVTLPDGAAVASDPLTGEALQGAVMVSGEAAIGSNTLLTANVIPAAGSAPAQVVIRMTNSTGFGIGECVTINFTRTAAGTYPANAAAFVLTGVAVKGPNGLPLAGVTIVPTGLSGL
ncbi:MAG TPA: hypothetical protein VFK23_11060 [Nitrospirota bacterium]|nr:hypothetical protein [Nitrospirota bacterium]